MTEAELKKQQNEIAKRLRSLADRVQGQKLLPEEVRLIRESVVPALEYLVNKDVDFFAVLAYGDDVRIHDWSHSPDAPLFEISGRVHQLSNMLGAMAVHEEVEQMEECERCQHKNCEPVN
jgi:hypothetical protein